MPAEIAETPDGPFVRLDFEGSSLLYTCPSELIATADPGEVQGCLERLRGGEAAGFISYEAGLALEPKLAPLARASAPGDPPLLWFGLFERIEEAPPLAGAETAWAGPPEPAISRDLYAASVEEIGENIRAGDVYQVNFTFPCSVSVAGHPMALYAQLRERGAGQWSALVFTGSHWLISCSPELFFTLEDRRITCRPMKGTAPAGDDPMVLRSDPKNRAENLMIVDLVRNDLSRIARAGSVKVETLFAVEEYPTILQMTSTVTAELPAGKDAVDVLATMFPCGSITGAPKIAAMERIAALEEGLPRGPYTGSIGHIRANGDAEFNVAIRTLILDDGERVARLNVGSGIVFDSDPISEWDECLQKAAFVASRADLELFETFAFGAAPSPLMRLHLDRIERSARALGFPFDRPALQARLSQLKPRLQGTVRLRISLEGSGAFRFDTAPLPDIPTEPVSVRIVTRTNRRDDFRLAHKTSDRGFYDEARERAGTFEILFVDEEGFLTEGSFTNLFVAVGEVLATPPLSRGLLPGILRQQLIEEGRAVERDLRPQDLNGGFWVGNSLRGLIPAVTSKLNGWQRS